MQAGRAAQNWERTDTEAVVCCVCSRAGRPIYDLDPFGVVRCPRCSLVFVSPRLTPDALQRLYDDVGYFEGAGSVYGGSGVNGNGAADSGGSGVSSGGSRFSPAMALQRRWMAGRLDLAEQASGKPATGARLLEIGSAYGLFLTAARRRGYDVTGVELSASAAAHARERSGLTVHSTQLAEAPLDGRFDVICAWDTIEHVPDPVDFWRAVRRLVADDGVALFSTPYFSSLPARVLRERWWTLKPTEHIWHFTPRTHRTVAEHAGMQIDRFVLNPLARANFGRLDSLVGVARPAR
ncbi:class I SAM-dependent methyltransferase [uncultured Jatrophihabitans sp.]|uniref:class I SAM-dependent methyltransferase n=1 Tax=uncultured Jatrophihabitans sp. TaxID=1610747 RepID=UPI0035CAFC86